MAASLDRKRKESERHSDEVLPVVDSTTDHVMFGASLSPNRVAGQSWRGLG
jgi:hypothetical protein